MKGHQIPPRSDFLIRWEAEQEAVRSPTRFGVLRAGVWRTSNSRTQESPEKLSSPSGGGRSRRWTGGPDCEFHWPNSVHDIKCLFINHLTLCRTSKAEVFTANHVIETDPLAESQRKPLTACISSQVRIGALKLTL